MPIEDELKEMSDALEEPSVDKEEFKTDPPSTEPSSTEAPSTESPNTESPNTESSSTEAPSTDAPEEDTIALLMDRIKGLEDKLKDKDTTESPSTNAPSTEAHIEDGDFISDLDLDELSRDPELLGKVLNDVYKKAVIAARTEVRKGDEYVIRSIPELVRNNMAIVSKLKKVSDSFYSDNKDLKSFKDVVGVVLEKMISDNPDKSYEELLPEVADETRRRLGLHKKATDNNPPPLPDNRRRGRISQQPPKTDPLLNELDEMDRALGLD